MACNYCGAENHSKRACLRWWSDELARIGALREALSTSDATNLYSAARRVFRYTLLNAGYALSGTNALLTKFNDAGPRSAPTAAFSKVKPGRPQSGADGNRINRWLLPNDHKQYATESEARLVGARFILQALSLDGAPEIPDNPFVDTFTGWLVTDRIVPGAYLDPIMLEPIDFDEMFENPRIVTSGHIIPLSHGGGVHSIENAFLQLKKSNDLQGDNAVEELLEMMEGILKRHGRI